MLDNEYTFDEDDIPWVDDELRAQRNLDQREGFLLSRIDGALSVQKLCQVSPLSRSETLSALEQLVDKGVVHFNRDADSSESDNLQDPIEIDTDPNRSWSESESQVSDNQDQNIDSQRASIDPEETISTVPNQTEAIELETGDDDFDKNVGEKPQSSPSGDQKRQTSAQKQESEDLKTQSLLEDQEHTWDARKARRSILSMFASLKLEGAVDQLLPVLTWDLSEEAHRDIEKFLVQELQGNVEILEDMVNDFPEEEMPSIVEFATKLLPESRSILIDILKETEDPEIKTEILKSLRGSWTDSGQAKRILSPLVSSSNLDLKMEALIHLTETNSKLAYRELEKVVGPDLAQWPDDKLKELMDLFIQTGGGEAIEKLKSLIQQRGFVGKEKIRMSKQIARSLVKTPTPRVLNMLEEINDSWFVPKEIKKTCRDVLNMLSSEAEPTESDGQVNESAPSSNQTTE